MTSAQREPRVDAASGQASDDDIDVWLLDFVWWLHERSMRHLGRRLRHLCTFAQFRMLYVVRSPYVSVAEKTMARRLGCSRANVSQSVARLEREGWLARIRVPSDDKRLTVVELTARGRQICDQSFDEVVGVAELIFAGLDREEKKALVGLLRKAFTSNGGRLTR